MQPSSSHPQRGRSARWFLILALLAAIIPQQAARAAATIVYVVPGGAGARSGADWANAMDLQPALSGAASGSEIWVRQGAYQPGSGPDRSATFQLKSGVAVYGGFDGTETQLSQRNSAANPTILSGDLLGNDGPSWGNYADNAYHVVSGGGADQSAILDGFTINGGNADGAGPASMGGGLWIDQGRPTIRNARLTRNRAGSGAGLMVKNGAATLSRVNIVDNGGGGIWNNNSVITMTNGLIQQNGGQGGIVNEGTTLIANSLIEGNGAMYCGAFNNVGQLTLLNVTIAGHLGETPLCNELTGRLTMRNSILWNARPHELMFSGGIIDIQYSVVRGGYPGVGNLTVDPKFNDPIGLDGDPWTPDTDLRLQPTSPAINAGLTSLAPADFTDLDGDGDTAEMAPFDLAGESRQVGLPIDMGAYENGGGLTSYCGPMARLYVRPQTAVAGTGWSWQDAYTDLAPALDRALRCNVIKEIWVAGGTYKPAASDRDASFQMRNGLAIYGGFYGFETRLDQRVPGEAPSILSGDLLGNDSGPPALTNPTRADNTKVLVQANGSDRAAILDGFTVTGGNNNGSQFAGGRAGGMNHAISQATVRNVTFIGNAGYSGGAMNILASAPLIMRSRFFSNTAEYGGAIDSYRGKPLITQSIFTGNRAAVGGGALHSSGQSQPQISHSVFTANTAPQGSAINNNNYTSSPSVVRNSIVWGDSIVGVLTAEYSVIPFGPNGPGNIYANPQFMDSDGPDNIPGTLDDDLHLQPGSPAINAGSAGLIPADLSDEDSDGDTAEPLPVDMDGRTRVLGPTVDMGAYESAPSRLHVVPGGAGTRSGADWANAMDLQPALTAATRGSEIWVKRGTYRPDSAPNIHASFRLRPGVAVYGGFAGAESSLDQRDTAANPTILSGDLLGDDNAFSQSRVDNVMHVVTAIGVRAAALDGFTVSGGAAHYQSLVPAWMWGGAGMLTRDSEITLRKMTFMDNIAEFDGAAMANYGSTVAIEDSAFSQNRAQIAGAIVNRAGSHMSIADTEFANNQAITSYGGAIANLEQSTLSIKRALFRRNQSINGSGGAVFNRDSQATLTQTTLISNTGGSGGALTNENGSFAVSQSLFNYNRTSCGPTAVSNSSGTFTLSQVTIRDDNRCSIPVVGIFTGTLSIRNSIIWASTDPIQQHEGTLDIRFSLIEGGYPGQGNLDLDPLFIDADGTDNITGTLDDDLRLGYTSPAIDAGSDALIPADLGDADGDGDTAEPLPLDLDGQARVSGTAVDMGAYEQAVGGLTVPPAAAMYGTSYSHQFSSAEPIAGAYEVITGSLPLGLGLDPASGLLSGTPTAAGTYTATVGVSTSGGAARQRFTITVAPAPLLISANDVQRDPGAANPPLTVRYSGFVLGDDAADLGGAPACATTATLASPPGSYPITCTAGSIANPNYALSFAPGTLTIAAFRLALPLIRR